MTEPRIEIVCPYSVEWPRNSEGSIAVLPDGRWLLAWTAYYGGFWDEGPAHITGNTYPSLAFDGDLVLVTYSLGQVDVDDKVGYQDILQESACAQARAGPVPVVLRVTGRVRRRQ